MDDLEVQEDDNRVDPNELDAKIPTFQKNRKQKIHLRLQGKKPQQA